MLARSEQARPLQRWRQQMLERTIRNDDQSEALFEIETRHIPANEAWIGRAPLCQLRPCHVQHGGRAINCDHRKTRVRKGKRDAACAAGEIEDWTTDLARLRQIEVNVTIA